MSSFTFPTSAALQLVAQDKLPRLMENRLGFRIIPAVNEDAATLAWDQEDNWTGLQALRGMGGSPRRIKKIGSKRYGVLPGVYGEYELLDEVELTMRRALGTFGTPVNLSDLVMKAQDRLLQRRLDRIEYITWLLLTTGTYSVSSEDGLVVHADTYSLQTFSASVPWATVATATPLADFRSVQLKSRGHSVSFGADAMAVMNRKTANNLLANTNPSDLAGKRMAGLAQPLSIDDANRLLAGEGLPQIEIYDEGYLDDSGTFQPYIPDAKVVVGRRPGGQPIADYAMTRNVNNPDLAPGAYMKIIDRGETQVPRSVEVHDGHNGGIRFYFPSAVVIMTVS
jgi:hypothetical protein